MNKKKKNTKLKNSDMTLKKWDDMKVDYQLAPKPTAQNGCLEVKTRKLAIQKKSETVRKTLEELWYVVELKGKIRNMIMPTRDPNTDNPKMIKKII